MRHDLAPRLLAISLLAAPLCAQTTVRCSTDSNGVQGNKESGVLNFRGPHPSADGRFVSFFSKASNLVPGDTNNAFDIFVKDTLTGETTRVSVATGGGEADAESRDARISPDGRYVVFGSFSRTIVQPHVASTQDIFVHDRTLGTTVIVSVPTAGGQANQNCSHSDLSDDGASVVFESTATNLISGDANGVADIFLVDVATLALSRVSRGMGGGPTDGESRYPDLSGDGRFCVFESSATNLVASDTNATVDVYLVELATGVNELVSVSSGGTQGQGGSIHPCISYDGRYVAFQSSAPDLVPGDANLDVDVFVRDRVLGTLVRASLAHDDSEAQGRSDDVSISADGRWIAFTSSAPNLLPGDSNFSKDIFRRDLLLGGLERISEPAPAGEANADSVHATVSADGSYVAFASVATNLVPGDTNSKFDAFLRTPLPAVSVYCSAKTNSLGCAPAISAAGASSASSASGFTVSAANVLSNKPGILLHGVDGPGATPFQGGFLCIAPPVRRAPAVQSGGTAFPVDCTGVLALDVNAFASGALGGSPTPELAQPGTFAYCQWWSRDNGFAPPDNSSLSDAFAFVVGH